MSAEKMKFYILLIFAFLMSSCGDTEGQESGDTLNKVKDRVVHKEKSFAENLAENRQSADSADIRKRLAEIIDTSYFGRFDSEIERFVRSDKEAKPDTGQILFIGSSSIRKWKNIASDLKPAPVINRGFGGATIAEVIRYADKIIFPYKPEKVFLYAGENDCAQDDFSPEDMLKVLDIYVDMMQYHLPESELYFLSLKPSPARKQYWKKFQKANKLAKEYCNSVKNLTFIDVSTAMLMRDGSFNHTIYLSDNLHMNSYGYIIWSEILLPYLK